MSVSPEKIAAVLGGEETLGRPVNRITDLEAIVQAGIPKIALDQLIRYLAGTLNNEDLIVRLRNKIVPRATYQRTQTFNLQVSETAERLARLYAMLSTVFEDERGAVRFLMSPHPELEQRIPFEVALTEIGGRQVEEVIERGLHGFPA